MAGAEPGLKEARAEEGEEAWRLPVEDSPWAAQRLADRQRAAEALGARGQRLQAAAGSYAAALGALGAAQQAFAQALGGAAPHIPPPPAPRRPRRGTGKPAASASSTVGSGPRTAPSFRRAAAPLCTGCGDRACGCVDAGTGRLTGRCRGPRAEFCEEEGGEDGAIADLRRALPLDALLAPFANVADCQSLLRSQVNLLLCHSLFHLVTEDTGRAAEQQRKVHPRKTPRNPPPLPRRTARPRP